MVIKKDKILERLDQYRAKEIDALWQRSAFLGTFLVLGYTGYGFLVDKIVSVPASNVLVGSELKAVLNISVPDTTTLHFRSEERRVGKECRSRWSPYH